MADSSSVLRTPLLGALLLIAVAAGAGAQQAPAPKRDSSSTAPTTPASAPSTPPLLDAPVNRATYRLGAGDVVAVSVVGMIDRMHVITVSPEGTVVVPSLGVVPVLGLSLDAAQAAVRNLVLRNYRDVSVTLTLLQLRSFKVYVLGAVEKPGMRTASSATRVSEVVEASPLLKGAGDGPTILRRNILLRRLNGDTVRVDLARFARSGDLALNPTLSEGDELVVPVLDRTVDVVGRVSFPGRYEYRPGESLAQLLRIVNGGGGFLSSAADTVRVSRFISPTDRRTVAFTLAGASGAEGAAFQLQPFDAVYVSEISNFMVQRAATVQGQVNRPGTYPIRPDTTTVRELVAMAGGFTPNASLSEARLVRPANRPAARSTATATSLSDAEKQIDEIRAQGAANVVVLDFARLYSGDGAGQDLTVRSGDVIEVPERRNDVVVSGAVGRPGIVRYEPGQPIDYYVERAGGYVRRADKHVVVLTATGTRLDRKDDRAPEPGDEILVPFARPVGFLERWQTTNAIVGTISGLVLTIFTIKSLF